MTQLYIVYNVRLRQYWHGKVLGITADRRKAYKFTAEELREQWSTLNPVKAKANLRIIPVRPV